MRKSIVAVIVVLGSLSIPATPALASHCTRPYVDPARDPKGFVLAMPAMAQYFLCELSHR